MTTPTAVPLLSGTSVPVGGTPAMVVGGGDRARLEDACTTAGLQALVRELPEGYETPIGADGVLLSAVQRLRLAVARLLVADPESLTLDDPTGGMDAAEEAAVLPAVEALLRGRDIRVLRVSPAVRQAVDRARLALSKPLASESQPAPLPAPALTPVEDAALPGLPLLLDPGAMTVLLRRAAPDADVTAVRVDSVRYKPGENVVVGYRVATRCGWSTAVAYASRGSAMKRKRQNPHNCALAGLAGPRAPTRRPLGRIREAGALVQWLPLDVRLPMLSDDGPRLERRLAKFEFDDLAGAEPELLRYWPRRRATLRFGGHVLKLYRDPADFAHALQGLRAAHELRRVQTPAYEGAKKRHLVTLQEFVKGCPPAMRPRASEDAGRLLAELHRERTTRLPVTSTADILAKAVNRAEFVARLLPELGEALDSLLTRMAVTIPQDLPAVTSHGNFHAGQLLRSPRGLVLLDLDRLCLAAPAYDLASFAAHVAFGRPGETELLEATVDSIVTGYGVRPRGLQWFLATSLLRRTAVPFRYQDEGWRAATARLVVSAREVL